jgi:hypothetical protein
MALGEGGEVDGPDILNGAFIDCACRYLLRLDEISQPLGGVGVDLVVPVHFLVFVNSRSAISSPSK